MSLEILNRYKIKAKKALGQNFLVNEKIVKQIADSIDIKWKNIVEVWPGYWALTLELLNRKPNSLNLVELDKSMIDILNDRIELGELGISWVDFNINNIDVLKYKPESPHPKPQSPHSISPKRREEATQVPSPFGRGVGWGLWGLWKWRKEYTYSVIANIPYYITSPILRHFLYNLEKKPEKMVILMQKDVWEKIIHTSPPTPLLTGGEGSIRFNKIKSSVLGLLVAKKCMVKEILFVWKENFVPIPKVESSVLLFEKHDLYGDIDDEKFLKIIKKWFSAVRKKLVKNFIMWWYEKQYILDIFKELWFNENIRWEDLDIKEWCELVEEIK